MTTPGKAKLIADESARDLDAGLAKETGHHAAQRDEARAERDPGRDHEPAGDGEPARDDETKPG